MTVYSGFFKLLKNTQQKESLKDSFLNPALQHHGKTVTSLLRPLYLTTFKPPGKTAIYSLVKKNPRWHRLRGSTVQWCEVFWKLFLTFRVLFLFYLS